METKNLNNRLIIVRSGKNNKNYKKFKEMMNDEIKNKFKSLDVNIFEEQLKEGDYGANKFSLYIYGGDGSLINQMNQFSNFDNIINNLQLTNQKGGNIYEKKYKKYKRKYQLLKNLSILF